MEAPKLLSYSYICILHMFCHCYITSQHPVNKRELCMANLSYPIDFNDFFQIENDSLARFLDPFALKDDRRFLSWKVPTVLKIDSGHLTYQIILNESSFRDIILSLSFFNAELYIDIHPNEILLKSVCGVHQNSDPILFGQREELFDDEVCFSFSTHKLWNLANMEKLRFSQGFNQSYHMYEYYPNFTILSVVGNSLNYRMTRLIFDTNGSINSENLKIPELWSNFYHCPGDVKPGIDQASPWPEKTFYDLRSLFVRVDKLCDIVTNRGLYNIIVGRPNQEDKYRNVSLSRENSTYASVLYALYEGEFTYVKTSRQQNFAIFTDHIDVLTQLPRKLVVSEVNKFSINMTSFIKGQCSIFMQNYKNQWVERQHIPSYEKFSAFQYPTKVFLKIESRGYPESEVTYEDHYIMQINCTTSEDVASSYLTISWIPVIKLRQHMMTC